MSGPSVESVREPADTAGFFGKLPMRGDFVARRVDHSVRQGFDSWLGDAMQIGRDTAGADWADRFLTSPIWRFAVAPGVLAAPGLAGVIMPSQDSVRRLFPLVILADLGEACDPVSVPGQASDWFSRAEETALDALEEDQTLQAFDALVRELGVPSLSACQCVASPGKGALLGRVRADESAIEAPNTDLYAALASAVGGANRKPGSVFWTPGSDSVEPSLLWFEGLPSASAYPALVNGDWAKLEEV